MKKVRVVVSVISDLVSDQRVHRVCSFLNDNNYKVTLIGRKLNKSLEVEERPYKTVRIKCYFSRGILQYAEFNLKLFLYLFFKWSDIFLSNDLDTLVPNFIHSKLRGKKLVYDSHEYFTGVPELQSKPLKRNFWKWIEKIILPRIKYAYTVNESIAQLYKAETGIEMKVVRNVPNLLPPHLETEECLFPMDKTILILQGAGINRGRGAEELVESMLHLPPNFLLVLIGSGDVWEDLKRMQIDLMLQEKVWFIEKVPFDMLKKYTRQGHLGLSMDKPLCLNYELSLPNKIFDYLHSGLPVLSSEVNEIKKILSKYQVGTTISEIRPKAIASAVLSIFENRKIYYAWRKNTMIAAKELCWQKEQDVLKEIFELQ